MGEGESIMVNIWQRQIQLSKLTENRKAEFVLKSEAKFNTEIELIDYKDGAIALTKADTEDFIYLYPLQIKQLEKILRLRRKRK